MRGYSFSLLTHILILIPLILIAILCDLDLISFNNIAYCSDKAWSESFGRQMYNYSYAADNFSYNNDGFADKFAEIVDINEEKKEAEIDNSILAIEKANNSFSPNISPSTANLTHSVEYMQIQALNTPEAVNETYKDVVNFVDEVKNTVASNLDGTEVSVHEPFQNDKTNLFQ